MANIIDMAEAGNIKIKKGKMNLKKGLLMFGLAAVLVCCLIPLGAGTAMADDGSKSDAKYVESTGYSIVGPFFISAHQEAWDKIYIMVGLSEEMDRELKWREYPTDQRSWSESNYKKVTDDDGCTSVDTASATDTFAPADFLDLSDANRLASPDFGDARTPAGVSLNVSDDDGG